MRQRESPVESQTSDETDVKEAVADFPTKDTKGDDDELRKLLNKLNSKNKRFDTFTPNAQ